MKRIEQNLRAKVNNENVGDTKRVETPRDAENLELWKRIDRIRECLVAPFREEDVEWRVVRSYVKSDGVKAVCMPYLTSRAVQERLDEVLGISNWRDSYEKAPIGNGVICKLSLRLPGEGGCEWIAKEDVAEASDVEPVKGSISNALKRAAVKWGIGRYLYNLGDSWAEISESGRYSFKAEDGKVYRWNPPAMPNWARISESLNCGDTVFGNSDEKSNWTPSGHGDVRSDGAQLSEGSHTEWRGMSIHFGKNKGQTLGELTAKQLSWYQYEWLPKPYNGRISAEDKRLRDALDVSKKENYPKLPESPNENLENSPEVAMLRE